MLEVQKKPVETCEYIWETADSEAFSSHDNKIGFSTSSRKTCRRCIPYERNTWSHTFEAYERLTKSTLFKATARCREKSRTKKGSFDKERPAITHKKTTAVSDAAALAAADMSRSPTRLSRTNWEMSVLMRWTFTQLEGTGSFEFVRLAMLQNAERELARASKIARQTSPRPDSK